MRTLSGNLAAEQKKSSYKPQRMKSYLDMLTPREKEIAVLLLAQENGNKQIAFKLNISEQTVKNHMTHILPKLNCTSRSQAAVRVAGELSHKKRGSGPVQEVKTKQKR